MLFKMNLDFLVLNLAKYLLFPESTFEIAHFPYNSC